MSNKWKEQHCGEGTRGNCHGTETAGERKVDRPHPCLLSCLGLFGGIRVNATIQIQYIIHSFIQG